MRLLTLGRIVLIRLLSVLTFIFRRCWFLSVDTSIVFSYAMLKAGRSAIELIDRIHVIFSKTGSMILRWILPIKCCWNSIYKSLHFEFECDHRRFISFGEVWAVSGRNRRHWTNKKTNNHEKHEISEKNVRMAMLRLFDDAVIVLVTRLVVILIYTHSQVVLRMLLASHIPAREPMLLGALIKLVRKPLARIAYKC